jgi:hypothetical protein
MLVALFPIPIALPFVLAVLLLARTFCRWLDKRAVRVAIGLVMFGWWLVCFLLFPGGATLVSGKSLWGIDFSLCASPLEYVILLLLALVFILSQFYPAKDDKSKGNNWSLIFWGWGFTQLFVLSSALLPEIFSLLLWGLLPVIRLSLPGGDAGKDDGTRMAYFVSAVGISLIFAWITGCGKFAFPASYSFAPPISTAISAGLVFVGLAILTLLGATPFASYSYLLRQKTKIPERTAFSFQLIVLGGYLMIRLSTAVDYGGSFLPFLVLGSIAILGGGFSALKETAPDRYRVQLGSLFFGLLLLFLGSGNPQGASAVMLGILLSLVTFVVLGLLWLWRTALPHISQIASWVLAIVICGVPPAGGYFLWSWGYSSLLSLPLWQKTVFLPVAVLGQGLLFSAVMRIRPIRGQSSAGKQVFAGERLVSVFIVAALLALAFGPFWSNLAIYCQSGKFPMGSILWDWNFYWSVYTGFLTLMGLGVGILLLSLSRQSSGELSGGENPIFQLPPLSTLYRVSAGGWFDSYRYLYYGIRFISFALLRTERAIDRLPASITWVLTLPGRMLYDRLFRNVKGR